MKIKPTTAWAVVGENSTQIETIYFSKYSAEFALAVRESSGSYGYRIIEVLIKPKK
jgi:hypothetical protein